MADTGRLAHRTHFWRVSRELFWVGTRLEVISEQDSMQKCGAKVPDWPETQSERPVVTGEESQRWLRVVLEGTYFWEVSVKLF